MSACIYQDLRIYRFVQEWACVSMSTVDMRTWCMYKNLRTRWTHAGPLALAMSVSEERRVVLCVCARKEVYEYQLSTLIPDWLIEFSDLMRSYPVVKGLCVEPTASIKWFGGSQGAMGIHNSWENGERFGATNGVSQATSNIGCSIQALSPTSVWCTHGIHVADSAMSTFLSLNQGV